MNSNTSTKSNFGFRGWVVIIAAGMMFYLFAAVLNDGMNLIVENFSTMHGLDYNTVLAVTTPAAFFGILGLVFWTVVVNKIGSRAGGTIALLLGAVCYACYSVVSTQLGFFVVTALVNFMACGFSDTAAKVMIAHWFPTRKGLALGWATMGNNLSSATIVPLLLVFISWQGVNASYQIVGIIMAVVAVFFFLCTRSTPEELGIAPDNGEVTPEKLAAIRKEAMDYKSPWTVGKMLKTKQLWLCGLGYGSMIMITVAEISQLIPRLTAGGWSTERATGAMTVCALLGLVGSYGTGWLDQKIGCKKTSLLCASWFLLSVVFCILPSNNFTLSASIFFLGFGVGAVGNLFPSMLSDLFNRYDFVKAVGIANVMVMLLRSLTFSILAFGLAKFGSFNGAFILFAIISVVGLVCLILLRDERIVAPPASDQSPSHSAQ